MGRWSHLSATDASKGLAVAAGLSDDSLAPFLDAGLAGGRQPLLQERGQLGEGETAVGDDANVGGFGAADAAGDGVDVHEAGFGEQDDVAPIEELLKGVSAHGQDEVGALHGGAQGGDAQGEVAKKLGVGGGECHLCTPGLVDRKAHKVRQLHRLFVAVIVGEAVAHQHDGAGGVEQQGGGPSDALRAGPRGVVGGPGGHDIHLGDALEGVGGKPDVDGPLRVTVGLVEGAAESAGNLAGVGELDGPLGDRPDELGQIGHGLIHLTDIVVGGGDDHGCAGVEGVEHEGDAVGEPAVDVEADEGSATGSTGVGLAHAHGDAFLEGQDVAKLRVVAKQVDDGRLAGARVAKDVLDALGLEHFKQRLLAGHRFSHGGLQWGSARKDAGRAAGMPDRLYTTRGGEWVALRQARANVGDAPPS